MKLITTRHTSHDSLNITLQRFKCSKTRRLRCQTVMFPYKETVGFNYSNIASHYTIIAAQGKVRQ